MVGWLSVVLCASSMQLVGCGDEESTPGSQSSDGGEGNATADAGVDKRGTDGGTSGVGGAGSGDGAAAGSSGTGRAGSSAGGAASGGGATGGASSPGDASVGDAAVSVGDAAIVDGGDGGGNRPETTVQDVQQGTATGQVVLTGVYVTAIDDIGTSKGIWVADALSGASYQGVFVLTGNALPAVSVGDEVSVTGSVVEFDVPMSSGDTLTQIMTTVDQVSAPQQGGTPVPVTVGVDVLSGISDGEPYEGVLVRVGPVRVTSILSSNRFVLADNAGSSIVGDDDIFVTSAVVDACYSSIVGVMTINLVDDERRILPRSTADLTAGSGCN